MRFGEQCYGLATASAALLAARDTTLGSFHATLSLAIPARREDARSIGESSERLDAKVYARFLSSRR
jgi:hypothetical protein